MKTYRNQGRQNFLNFNNKRLRHCLYSLRSYKSRHGLWLHGFHGDIELEDSVYYNLMYGKVKAVSDNLLFLEEMLPRGKWKTLFLISVFFFLLILSCFHSSSFLLLDINYITVKLALCVIPANV